MCIRDRVIVSGHGSGAILRVGAAPIGSDSWEGKTYELPSLSAVTIEMCIRDRAWDGAHICNYYF